MHAAHPPPIDPPHDPAGIAARVNAERVALLAWSRAILMQIAHPLIAAGIDEHSSFRAGRFAAAARLHHTVRALLSLAFGSDESRTRTIGTINGIHRRVNGTLREATGPFPSGTRYSAEDPALLLWVHATLLESVPLLFERVVRPLSSAERDQYCAEAAWVPAALGAREGIPQSWRELQEYMARVYDGGVLVVGAQGQKLASEILSPPMATLVWPATYLNRLITVGLLPAPIREQYGISWTAKDERRMKQALGLVRRVRRVTPDAVALWPEARVG
jgi:uncharacterized protein (DUF2236 family)